MILNFIFLTITYLGGQLMIGIITILTALSFVLHKHKHRIVPLFLSVGGSTLTVFILKHVFFLPRPASAVYLETSSSFPSGHATLAMALYGFLIYTIWKHDPHPLKNPFIFLLGILIVLIGASRLYLGVHYFSDVLAGFLIGFIWIWIALAISKLKT